MRATTHTPVEELETDDEHETPWWADRAVLIPQPPAGSVRRLTNHTTVEASSPSSSAPTVA